MKKIVILIMVALAGMNLALAQQNFRIEVEGRAVNEGETIELDSLTLHLVIANASSEKVYIQPVFNTERVPESVIPQFCAVLCFGFIDKIGVLEIPENGFLGKEEDVHLGLIVTGEFDTAVVGCTFEDTTTHESLHFDVRFVNKKGTAAISRAELAGVSVYPNPAEGLFNLNVPERAKVEIFSANGQVLRQMEVSAGETTLQLNHAGIYFVRVRAKGKEAVKRLVIR